MKPPTLLILSILLSYSCFSQFGVSSTTLTTLNPVWLQVRPSDIRKNAVLQDSVYYFKTKENGGDSALIMIQYFDSVGNLIERDEFNIKVKGELARVTRFSYLDDELLQMEITDKTINLISKVVSYQKERYLYEYDSAGHDVSEKLYQYFGESMNKYRITVFDHLYDSTGHVIKTYHQTGNSDRFLQKTYKYNNGTIDEVNNYDSNYEITFTNVYRFDAKKNIQRIYMTDVSPDNLALEFFYDDKKRVKQQKRYSLNDNYINSTTRSHFDGTITQNYWYGTDDLIIKQVVKTEHDGTNYFYKHYYAKQ